MLQIKFSLSDVQVDSRKGFRLGDITICGESGEATSAARTPDQSVMLILSIVELLDGVRRSLLTSTNKKYRFVGVDSSFSITFRKSKALITVHVDDKLIHTATASSIKADIEQSVLEFIKTNDVAQISDAAEAYDLENALRAFRELSID